MGCSCCCCESSCHEDILKEKVSKTLIRALIDSAERFGLSHIIAEDTDRKPATYADFLVRCFALSRQIERAVPTLGSTIGLMLPNAVDTAASIFAIHILGKAAAMVNFNSGLAAILNACKMAELKVVLTSERFIAAVQGDKMVAALQEAGVRLVYIEQLSGFVKPADALKDKLVRHLPSLMAMSLPRVSSKAPALILFTSGSEGIPKGVALSHENILANIVQFTTRITVVPQDVLFACLPMYHSFGLTVGVLLPIISGVKVFLYPVPLHYHIIPTLMRELGVTITLSTDTFLMGYARCGKGEDFRTLRCVIAGAERLKDETRRLWEKEFGVAMFEGYGATETAPVLTVNWPEKNRIGSVGPLLPGIEAKLEPVMGLDRGGRLIVKGPNVMLGYMKIDAPGIVQPLGDGWYDTGDIVFIDDDGFVTILGRQKRFAKVGGEMLSLPAVEQAMARAWPEKAHIAVSIPHARRGESIIVLTENHDLTLDQLPPAFREAGLPDLAVPRRLIFVDKIPVLGSGKTDYVSARELALQADSK